MGVTGEEVYNFLLSENAQPLDLLVGQKEDGSLAACFLKTAIKTSDTGRTHIFELKSIFNGWDGYPEHHRKEVFPMHSLKLYRFPMFSSEKGFKHLVDNDEITATFRGAFVADMSERKKMVKSEREELEKTFKDIIKNVTKSVENAEKNIENKLSNFKRRAKSLLNLEGGSND